MSDSSRRLPSLSGPLRPDHPAGNHRMNVHECPQLLRQARLPAPPAEASPSLSSEAEPAVRAEPHPNPGAGLPGDECCLPPVPRAMSKC